MFRLLRRILLILAIGLATLVVGFVIAVSLGIRVDLSPFREPFEVMASKALGREVKLEGEVFLVPTWSVTVEANGLRVANPEGWEPSEFARLDLARVQIDVLPILLRRIVVRELRAEGIEVVFVRRADGATNWSFDVGSDAAEDSAAESPPEAPGEDGPVWQELLPSAVVLEELALHDIRAELHDAVGGVDSSFILERLDGAAATNAPLEFSLSGSLDDHPFSASLQGGDTSFLIGGNAPWPLRSELEIGGTRFTLAALVDERSWDFTDALTLFLETARAPLSGLEGQRLGEVTVTIEGERLDSLDPVLEVSLPPWGPHRFEGRFEAFGGGDLSAHVTIRVGSSELTGKLTIAGRAEPPRIELTLNAPSIQLDDFRLGGWSAIEDSPAPAPSPTAKTSAPAETGRALLSPEVMRSLDAKLVVDVAKVASGRDWLGQGRLSAQLEKGRFRLDAFDIKVPGGSIKTKASLTPRRRSVSGTVSVMIDRFDYGILVRRVAPDTDMHGLFAMEVDLKSTAPNAMQLLENASGRFDFAVFPGKLEAGVMDLWAVNLVAAVLPAIDSAEESKVNCAVALMDMQDGIMHQHALLVDTTNLSVAGEAELDFREQHIDLLLAPKPKRPEFFSVATPIRVEGSFEDFGIGVAPADVLETLISFVTSVIHVPIRRIFTPPSNPEELDACMAALDLR